MGPEAEFHLEILFHQSSTKFDCLNNDCLSHILDRLTLQEMVCLRRVCKSLNTLVCERLQSKQTLRLFGEEKETRILTLFANDLSVSYPHIIDRKTYNTRAHYNDVLLIAKDWYSFQSRKASSFMLFISARMPNITKLVFFMRDFKAWEYVHEILDSMPNLKSVYLDSYDCYCTIYTKELFDPLFYVLFRLTKLEELFLFPKAQKQLTSELEKRYHEFNYKYLEALLGRLRVFHTFTLMFISGMQNYPNLQDLGCIWLPENVSLTSFPNLKKLTTIGYYNDEFDTFSSLRQISLESLHLDVHFSFFDIEKLNQLTSVKEFTCNWFQDYENFIPTVSQENHSIVHIRLGYTSSYHNDQKMKPFIRILLKVFRKLKTLSLYEFDSNSKQKLIDAFFNKVDFKFYEYLSAEDPVEEVEKCIEKKEEEEEEEMMEYHLNKLFNLRKQKRAAFLNKQLQA